MKRHIVPFCAGLLLAASVSYAEVKFDDCFGNNMVIQRELPARFRGTADPGEEVTLSFAGQTASTVADGNGDWKITLAPLKASKTPQELTVRGRDNTVTLKNVLIGEVWLCTGQSNMFYRVWDKDPKMRQRDSEAISAAADYPLIRTVLVTCAKSPKPERRNAMSWCPAVGDQVKPFSAVGYLFGVELFKALDVPIGLVRACVGGTNIESWTNPEGLRSIPEGRRYAASPAGRAAAETFTGNSLAAYYNAMIHPLTGMTVRGAIWYQGEQNIYEPVNYRWQMHALLNGWKLAFANPDLQFHFVQIAPYRYNTDLPMLCAGIWRAQRQFADETGCGMAVINDWGNPDDIHPNEKRPVGRRLALLALNRTYGRKDIVCDPPRVDSWKIDGNKFVLTFKNATGLKTPENKPVAGFEVAGIDGKYFPADVKIDGAKLEVSAPQVSAPRYLRYLAHNTDGGNLYSEHELVPAPFRLVAPTTEEELKYLTGRGGLIYEYDLFSGVAADGRMKPAADNAKKFTGKKLKRLYYLFVMKDKRGEVRYIDIALAPFTRYLDLIGVPGSKLKRNVAQRVRDIRIRTNAPELIPDSEFKIGNVEFFFTDYGPENVLKIWGGDDRHFDAGDNPSKSKAPGYGCMQFHARRGAPIFCFNNFKAKNECDLGFGPNPLDQPDWTSSRSGKNYDSAKLYVFADFE